MGGGGGPDKVTNTTEPPKYLRPYLKDAAGEASALAQVPFQMFPNQMFLPSNEFQDMGAAQALSYGTSPAMMAQINNAMGAQQSMLSAPDVANNPYISGIKDMNERRTTERLERYALPAAQDRAVAGMGLGGSRQAIEQGLARGEAERAMQDYNAQVDASAYDAGLRQQAAGMALVPQTMGLGYMPSQAMSAFGDYAARDPAMALAEQQERFNFPQTEPWDRLNRAMAVYSGVPGSVSTSSGPGGDTNPFMGAIGGGLLASQAAPYLGGALTSAGITGGTMGAGATGGLMAAGAANPLFWPLVIGGGALGSGILG